MRFGFVGLARGVAFGFGFFVIVFFGEGIKPAGAGCDGGDLAAVRKKSLFVSVDHRLQFGFVFTRAALYVVATVQRERKIAINNVFGMLAHDHSSLFVSASSRALGLSK